MPRKSAAPLTPERERILREKYPKLGRDPALMEELGWNEGQLRLYASRLKLRSEVHYRKMADARVANSTSVDQTYFDTWNHSMAWLLGYTWADGNVRINTKGGARRYRLQYGCVTDDVELLNQVRFELKSKHKLVPYQPKKGRHRTHLNIASRQLVTKLMTTYRMPERKSYVDPLYPGCPDEFFWDFARGVLDGDGCVTANGGTLPVISWKGSP